MTKKAEADFLDLVTKAKGTNRAISLFAIQGKPTEDGFVFSPSKDFFVFEASGSKAKDLIDIHQQVALVLKCDRVTLQSTFTPQQRRDWTQEQGIQVLSLHLKDLLQRSMTNQPSGSSIGQRWCGQHSEATPSPLKRATDSCFRRIQSKSAR